MWLFGKKKEERKTVSGIMAVFEKARLELQDLVEYNNKDIEEKDRQIDNLVAERTDLIASNDEAKHALKFISGYKGE